MRSFFATLLGLSLPPGVPGTSRTFIGVPLPPPLDTFVIIPGPSRYTGGIIFYGEGDDTTYTYLCATDYNSGLQTEIHLGHVLNGAVMVDAQGVPMVQKWRLSASGPTVMQLLNPEIFQVTVGVTPNQNQLQLDDAAFAVAMEDGSISLTCLGADAVGVTSVSGDVNITAGADLDLTGDTITFDGTPRVGPASSEQNAFIPYALIRDAAAGNTTITGTASGTATAINGISSNVNVLNTTDRIVVRASFVVIANGVVPTSTLQMVLLVDTVVQGGVPVKRLQSASDADTVTYEWHITGLSVASHTFSLSAFSSTGSEYIVTGSTIMCLDARYQA